MLLFALLLLGGVVGIVISMMNAREGTEVNRIWSPEHGHWHDVR
jgi:hypothetical protein